MTNADDADYILGHDESEWQRLGSQAEFMQALTRRAFTTAGLGPGMRVLDIGSGAGDVSLLAAELVGPTGAVVGIEREPLTVQAATARAVRLGAGNVQFIAGDVRTDLPDESFDAAVGRFVLMYVADPVHAVAAAAARLRPGGLVVFQEWHAADSFISTPPVELWDGTGAFLVDTFRRAGSNVTIGLGLRGCLDAAGLVDLKLTAERIVGGGPSFGGYAYLTGVIRSIAPAIEHNHRAAVAALDLDTLEYRLRDDVTRADATVAFPTIVTAWGQ